MKESLWEARKMILWKIKDVKSTTVMWFSLWIDISVQLLSHVRLFATPLTAVYQSSLFITNSWRLLKLMSIESVMPSNHLILCHPLLLLPLIFPSIRVFSNESVLSHQVAKVLELQLQHQSFQWIFRIDICMKSFPASGSFPTSYFFASGGQSTGISASVSVLPMNIQDWFPLGLSGWISLQSKGLSRVFSNTMVQKHQFFGTQLSLWSNSHLHTWLLEKP